MPSVSERRFGRMVSAVGGVVPRAKSKAPGDTWSGPQRARLATASSVPGAANSSGCACHRYAVFDATGHRLRSLPLRVDSPLHPGR
jgi:hypothetical protein